MKVYFKRNTVDICSSSKLSVNHLASSLFGRASASYQGGLGFHSWPEHVCLGVPGTVSVSGNGGNFGLVLL
jgi:hypothetical protein